MDAEGAAVAGAKKDAKVLVAEEAFSATRGMEEDAGNAEVTGRVGGGALTVGGGTAGFEAGAKEKGVEAEAGTPKPAKPANLEAGAEGCLRHELASIWQSK